MTDATKQQLNAATQLQLGSPTSGACLVLEHGGACLYTPDLAVFSAPVQVQQDTLHRSTP